MLDSRTGTRVVSLVSHLHGSTDRGGPMRSTKGSALDPTRASNSASPPPPVHPPLHFASTFVLFLAATRFATPSARPHRWRGARPIRTARELYGHQDVRTIVSDGFYAGPHTIPYPGKTTPTENPRRELAPFVHVSPSGHMRVTLTGTQALCSYMDPDTQ